MKNNKGITLIALVITIIVLLILAGVSIALLTGENGILNKATGSKSTTIAANAEDKINLTLNAIKTEIYAQQVKQSTWSPLKTTTTSGGSTTISGLEDEDIIKGVMESDLGTMTELSAKPEKTTEPTGLSDSYGYYLDKTEGKLYIVYANKTQKVKTVFGSIDLDAANYDITEAASVVE